MNANSPGFVPRKPSDAAPGRLPEPPREFRRSADGRPRSPVRARPPSAGGTPAFPAGRFRGSAFRDSRAACGSPTGVGVSMRKPAGPPFPVTAAEGSRSGRFADAEPRRIRGSGWRRACGRGALRGVAVDAAERRRQGCARAAPGTRDAGRHVPSGASRRHVAGEETAGLAFLPDPRHRQHAGALPPPGVAHPVATASGTFGTRGDRLAETVASRRARGSPTTASRAFPAPSTAGAPGSRFRIALRTSRLEDESWCNRGEIR